MPLLACPHEQRGAGVGDDGGDADASAAPAQTVQHRLGRSVACGCGTSPSRRQVRQSSSVIHGRMLTPVTADQNISSRLRCELLRIFVTIVLWGVRAMDGIQ